MGEDISQDFCVYNRHIRDIFIESYTGNDHKGIYKKILDWVWCLSMSQCEILMYAMISGDGHYGLWKNCKNPVLRYDTSSVALRNDFQRLVFHCGLSANHFLKYPAG